MNTRVALVTGASSGIGAAIAQRLASTHTLIMSSSNADRLREAEQRLKTALSNANVVTIAMDVCVPSAIEDGIAKAVELCGRIDVLVNSAGIGGGGITRSISDELWDRILNTNLSGLFRVTRAVLIHSGMIERRWGRIVNIASTGGKQGVMYAAAYSASKHGVVGFTKSLGLELAKSGVTVNAVCPGFVETPLADLARRNYARLWECSVEEARTRIETRVPLGRYVGPEEVAAMVAYVVSDEASALIGQALNVCGGLGNY